MAPSFIARSRNPGFSLAVTKMIGVAAVEMRFWRRAATMNPSPAGNEMSSTMTSGLFLRTAEMALTASLAAYTVYPMLFRRTPIVSRNTLSSSTNNTVFIPITTLQNPWIRTPNRATNRVRVVRAGHRRDLATVMIAPANRPPLGREAHTRTTRSNAKDLRLIVGRTAQKHDADSD